MEELIISSDSHVIEPSRSLGKRNAVVVARARAPKDLLRRKA